MLKLKIGGDIPILYEHLGASYSSSSWSQATITNGVWREDEEDVVYGYSMDRPPNITSIVPSYITSSLVFSLLESVFGEEDYFVTTTHFWDADNGDLPQTLIRSGVAGITFKF